MFSLLGGLTRKRSVCMFRGEVFNEKVTLQVVCVCVRIRSQSPNIVVANA